MSSHHGSGRGHQQSPFSPIATTAGKLSSLRRRDSSASVDAYRIHFSCQNTGRSKSKPSWKFVWQFGLARSGKKGRDNWIEEHEVVLISSSRSGLTNVMWNGSSIDPVVRDGSSRGKLEYSWRTKSGEKLEIVGHNTRQPEAPQFNFFVDGTNFSDLLSSEEGVQCRYDPYADCEYSEENSILASDDLDLCEGTEVELSDHENARSNQFKLVPNGSGFRLSLAGLSQGPDFEDELRSALPCSSIDSLRDAIVAYLPDTEEMVSRAMLNALLERSISPPSKEASPLTSKRDMVGMEAEILWETVQWLKLYRIQPRRDMDDLKRTFLQRQLDSIFTLINRDILSVPGALNVVVNIGHLLQLKLVNPPECNTVLLVGLNKDTTPSAIIDELAKFGQIENVAVVEGTDFGVCRFGAAASVARVCEGAKERQIMISGVIPDIFPACEYQIRPVEDDMIPTQDLDSTATSPKTTVVTTTHNISNNSIQIDESRQSPSPYFLSCDDDDDEIFFLQRSSFVCPGNTHSSSRMRDKGFGASMTSSALSSSSSLASRGAYDSFHHHHHFHDVVGGGGVIPAQDAMTPVPSLNSYPRSPLSMSRVA